MMNLLKNFNNNETTIPAIYVKKLAMTQNLEELKKTWS